ncbi:MAG: ABC transporter ATP-binding protein [Bacillota bacterium]
MEHHLVLEDLCESFGDVQAVKNLNLKIKKGELITLLGPSGCGKTTTMHIIAGFHLPDRGRVILNGEDITYLAPYKRNTPMVFQEYALFPHLTVFENVAYGMAIRKVPKNEIQEKVKDILEQLGLPDIATRFPNQLSGGQQQRVALARALVLDPEVLLLDEPLSNLDAKLRIRVRYEIKQLQEKFNITMVYVTHDQEEALSISDRVAVMNKGVLEQYGTPWEIYYKPKNKFVAEFVGETNFLQVEIKEVRPSDDGTGASVVDFLWQDRVFSTSVENEGLSPGSTRTLLLRPEAIEPVGRDEEITDENTISGKVIDSSFLGSITRYRIDVGGEEIVVDDSKTKEHGVFRGEVKLKLPWNVHFL